MKPENIEALSPDELLERYYELREQVDRFALYCHVMTTHGEGVADERVPLEQEDWDLAVTVANREGVTPE